MPLVSIGIRSSDRDTLPRALASVVAQTHRPIEVVLVHAVPGHSVVPAELDDIPVRAIRTEAIRTRPEAAQCVLEHAQGEWIGFLDDDDELLPGHVEKLLGAAIAEGTRLAYGQVDLVDGDRQRIGVRNGPGHHAQFAGANRIAAMLGLFHRSLVEEGARFDPEFHIFEDWDFWIQCANRTSFSFVPETTARWFATIGTSGANLSGAHANDDAWMQRLHAKWTNEFETWSRDHRGMLNSAIRYLKLSTKDPQLRVIRAHDALQLAEAVLQQTPDDVNALNLAGTAHYYSANLDEAERLLTRAQSLVPAHQGIASTLSAVRELRSTTAS